MKQLIWNRAFWKIRPKMFCQIGSSFFGWLFVNSAKVENKDPLGLGNEILAQLGFGLGPDGDDAVVQRVAWEHVLTKCLMKNLGQTLPFSCLYSSFSISFYR